MQVCVHASKTYASVWSPGVLCTVSAVVTPGVRRGHTVSALVTRCTVHCERRVQSPSFPGLQSSSHTQLF